MTVVPAQASPSPGSTDFNSVNWRSSCQPIGLYPAQGLQLEGAAVLSWFDTVYAGGDNGVWKV